MKLDPQALDFAMHIVNLALDIELPEELFFSAVLLAYGTAAKHSPSGLDQPTRELERWAKELRAERELALIAAAQANQMQINFH